MVLFNEKQKFRQWWIWTALLAMAGLIIFGIYKQLALKEPFGNNPASDTGIIMVSFLLSLLILLFFFTELETEITENAVAYKFFPFVLKKVHLPWSDIEKAFIRKYRPISEYGGWGYRLGLFGYGRALNISGNMGLQLVKKNGKKLLIGTSKPDEVEKVILKLQEKKIINDNAS